MKIFGLKTKAAALAIAFVGSAFNAGCGCPKAGDGFKNFKDPTCKDAFTKAGLDPEDKKNGSLKECEQQCADSSSICVALKWKKNKCTIYVSKDPAKYQNPKEGTTSPENGLHCEIYTKGKEKAEKKKPSSSNQNPPDPSQDPNNSSINPPAGYQWDKFSPDCSKRFQDNSLKQAETVDSTTLDTCAESANKHKKDKGMVAFIFVADLQKSADTTGVCTIFFLADAETVIKTPDAWYKLGGTGNNAKDNYCAYQENVVTISTPPQQNPGSKNKNWIPVERVNGSCPIMDKGFGAGLFRTNGGDKKKETIKNVTSLDDCQTKAQQVVESQQAKIVFMQLEYSSTGGVQECTLFGYDVQNSTDNYQHISVATLTGYEALTTQDNTCFMSAIGLGLAKKHYAEYESTQKKKGALQENSGAMINKFRYRLAPANKALNCSQLAQGHGNGHDMTAVGIAKKDIDGSPSAQVCVNGCDQNNLCVGLHWTDAGKCSHFVSDKLWASEAELNHWKDHVDGLSRVSQAHMVDVSTLTEMCLIIDFDFNKRKARHFVPPIKQHPFTNEWKELNYPQKCEQFAGASSLAQLSFTEQNFDLPTCVDKCNGNNECYAFFFVAKPQKCWNVHAKNNSVLKATVEKIHTSGTGSVCNDESKYVFGYHQKRLPEKIQNQQPKPKMPTDAKWLTLGDKKADECKKIFVDLQFIHKKLDAATAEACAEAVAKETDIVGASFDKTQAGNPCSTFSLSVDSNAPSFVSPLSFVAEAAVSSQEDKWCIRLNNNVLAQRSLSRFKDGRAVYDAGISLDTAFVANPWQADTQYATFGEAWTKCFGKKTSGDFCPGVTMVDAAFVTLKKKADAVVLGWMPQLVKKSTGHEYPDATDTDKASATILFTERLVTWMMDQIPNATDHVKGGSLDKDISCVPGTADYKEPWNSIFQKAPVVLATKTDATLQECLKALTSFLDFPGVNLKNFVGTANDARVGVALQVKQNGTKTVTCNILALEVPRSPKSIDFKSPSDDELIKTADHINPLGSSEVCIFIATAMNYIDKLRQEAEIETGKSRTMRLQSNENGTHGVFLGASQQPSSFKGTAANQTAALAATPEHHGGTSRWYMAKEFGVDEPTGDKDEFKSQCADVCLLNHECAFFTLPLAAKDQSDSVVCVLYLPETYVTVKAFVAIPGPAKTVSVHAASIQRKRFSEEVAESPTPPDDKTLAIFQPMDGRIRQAACLSNTGAVIKEIEIDKTTKEDIIKDTKNGKVLDEFQNMVMTGAVCGRIAQRMLFNGEFVLRVSYVAAHEIGGSMKDPECKILQPAPGTADIDLPGGSWNGGLAAETTGTQGSYCWQLRDAYKGVFSENPAQKHRVKKDASALVFSPKDVVASVSLFDFKDQIESILKDANMNWAFSKTTLPTVSTDLPSCWYAAKFLGQFCDESNGKSIKHGTYGEIDTPFLAVHFASGVCSVVVSGTELSRKKDENGAKDMAKNIKDNFNEATSHAPEILGINLSPAARLFQAKQSAFVQFVTVRRHLRSRFH